MPTLLWMLLFSSAAIVASFDLVALALSSEEWTGRLTAGTPALALLPRRRGRPRKFAAPSRTVTLTLPESVIATLSALHHDLSQAIVGLTQRENARGIAKGADLLVFGHRAVITIRPTPSLESRVGVQLVPLPNGRALISFRDPTSLSALQLSIADALEDQKMSAEERVVYENLSEILRAARRSDDVAVEQRHIIVLESTRGTRTNAKPRIARKV
jgi:hypothetical protein